MAETTEARSAADQQKTVHHGRTTAAWVGSLLALFSFITGGIAVMMQNWVLFTIAAVVLVGGLIATKVLQVTGHGAD